MPIALGVRAGSNFKIVELAFDEPKASRRRDTD
jgi:hypothetical protein